MPKADYKAFRLQDKELIFVPKDELKSTRRKQAKTHYLDNMKIVSEDVLRIMLQVNKWRMSPGIPIELCRSHSFLFKDQAKVKSPTSGFPAVCHVKPIVNFPFSPP